METSYIVLDLKYLCLTTSEYLVMRATFGKKKFQPELFRKTSWTLWKRHKPTNAAG